jgi:hypothetical protein
MTRSRLMRSFALLASSTLQLQPMPAMAARPAPTARAATLLTPARLVGRWGDNGDCSKDVIFRGDGTFRSYTGGEGSWRLAGERLTMTGESGATVLIVRLIATNRIRIVNPDGSIGISQRC